MTTTVETTNGATEQLTEADLDSLGGIESAEEIESQLVENLDSVSVESVVEDVEALMEGNLERRTSSSQGNRQLIKVFTTLIKNAVKKITSNPKTRAKLQAACRKGPDAVTQLLTPIITKTLPAYLSSTSATFVPAIVARLFPAICKQVGLTAEEIPGGAEFWPFIIGGINLLGGLLSRKPR